jgi:hypothetical protein
MYTFVLFMVICVKIKMSTQKKGDILCSFGFYEVILSSKALNSGVVLLNLPQHYA